MTHWSHIVVVPMHTHTHTHWITCSTSTTILVSKTRHALCGFVVLHYVTQQPVWLQGCGIIGCSLTIQLNYYTHLTASFPGQPGKAGRPTKKVKPAWIKKWGKRWWRLGMQWHLQLAPEKNHTKTSSLNFYRPDALPDAQPTVSQHWRHNDTTYNSCQYHNPDESHIQLQICCHQTLVQNVTKKLQSTLYKTRYDQTYCCLVASVWLVPRTSITTITTTACSKQQLSTNQQITSTNGQNLVQFVWLPQSRATGNYIWLQDRAKGILTDFSTRHTHTFNGPFFRDYPGESVPER